MTETSPSFSFCVASLWTTLSSLLQPLSYRILHLTCLFLFVYIESKERIRKRDCFFFFVLSCALPDDSYIFFFLKLHLFRLLFVSGSLSSLSLCQCFVVNGKGAKFDKSSFEKELYRLQKVLFYFFCRQNILISQKAHPKTKIPIDLVWEWFFNL